MTDAAHGTETLHMTPRSIVLQSVIIVTLLVGALELTCFGQKKEEIIPGAVKLKNGVILRGLCSSGHSLTAGALADHRLDLRKIDQGFRIYFAATRTSDPIVPDDLAVPDRHFDIIQRAVAQRPMNFEIGLHKNNPFGPDGKSSIQLNLAGGAKAKIDVGIIGIDSRFVKVRGLTHRWMYGVSVKAIPDATLYAGNGLPALLPATKQFGDGDQQLNMVQMLMEAKKYAAAQRLLTDTQAKFPDLEQRCELLSEAWNEQVGDRVLVELNQLRDTGKPEMARRFARNWPDSNLSPEIRARARTFLKNLDEEKRAVETIEASLNNVIAELNDEAARRDAMRMCSELKKELNVNTLPKLAAYELLWQDPDTTAEAKIALAVTGWLLGADNAIQDFPEALGLFQTRYWVLDYLQTDELSTTVREQLIGQIRGTEGYSPERLAQLILHLSPDGSLFVRRDNPTSLGQFTIAATEDLPQCRGIVPREYDHTRRYPLIVAFSRGGGLHQSTVDWWAQQADRHGYIVAVPEIYEPVDGKYDATAEQHRMVLNTIAKLKAGLSVDDDRVFIAGHGIGAQAAMDLATAHPDLFAGVIPIAGLGRKHLLWTVGNSADLPWYVVAGSRQPSYRSGLMPLLRKLFSRVPATGRVLYCNALLTLYPERGFESYAEELPDIFRWMQLQRRPEFTDRLDVTTMRSTDLSWGWLELESIPQRFVSLDGPNTPEDRPETDGHVEASVSEGGNLIRIKALPGNGWLRVSEAIPKLDLQKPIKILSSGRTQRFDFKPSTRDMLEDFRTRRDRTRLCFMKVPIK